MTSYFLELRVRDLRFQVEVLHFKMLARAVGYGL